MKRAAIGPDEIFHRYLTPRWAHMPESGAGAAIGGGRFNRPGIEALYLSMSAQTALEEYRQAASITPPATLAAYRVTLDAVADLSAGFDPDYWEPGWALWDCSWRSIARIDRKTPPSWELADVVLSSGLSGILFPSLRHPGGTNLVVFPANRSANDSVAVHDPDGLLPRDQSSWRP